MGEREACETAPIPVQSFREPQLLRHCSGAIRCCGTVRRHSAQACATSAHTSRLTTVEFPVELDDGTVQTFTGYRALHSRVRGPGKGGIRYHPDVTPTRCARWPRG